MVFTSGNLIPIHYTNVRLYLFTFLYKSVLLTFIPEKDQILLQLIYIYQQAGTKVHYTVALIFQFTLGISLIIHIIKSITGENTFIIKRVVVGDYLSEECYPFSNTLVRRHLQTAESRPPPPPDMFGFDLHYFCTHERNKCIHFF